ncbi:hypothetical protein [uncultured Sphingomonas sp.]|uniref:hypothetical protein n=1 Tax=uncultured Sphingomonas sp. TaxID=158754 RepID=UPI0035CC1F8E
MNRAALAIVAALPAGGAAPPTTDRVELPVRLVMLSDGTPRFGVPMRIAGREVEAGLDTGSTGLRVMARALPVDARAGGAAVHYSYGSGTVLNGPEVEVPVAFGDGAPTAVRIQRVEHLSCIASRSHCPASRNDDPATFGIQGNGLPNEGFAAILGVNLRPSHQPNAFEATGVGRWIVELPVPGHTGAGRIILNPTAAETVGYRAMRFDSDDNSLPGCIGGERPVGTICGPATIDSGAPGLRVVQGTGHAPVPPGTTATIQIGSGKSAVAWQVATERRDQGSHLSFEQRPDAASPRLFLGTAPYYRFSILFDADAHTIGFKPH